MSQQAWEVCMGMRGYAGSPAERESRTPDGAVTVARGLEIAGTDDVIVQVDSAKVKRYKVRKMRDGSYRYHRGRLAGAIVRGGIVVFIPAYD